MKLFSYLTSTILISSLIAGCQTTTTTGKDFPIVVGASAGSELKPCADYASHFNYSGKPYYVRVPETGKIVTRHQGIDFCASPNTPVIASTNGQIVSISYDNIYRGGRVTMSTGIRTTKPGSTSVSPIYLDYLHITPNPELAWYQEIKAGDVIGWLQPPGKQEIGRRSHVHLTAGTCVSTWACHTDPNQYWVNGPGKVTCFDPNNPPPDDAIVAPLRC